MLDKELPSGWETELSSTAELSSTRGQNSRLPKTLNSRLPKNTELSVSKRILHLRFLFASLL